MTRQRHKTGSVKEPLSVTHPELAAEWHPAKNGDTPPEDVVAGSHQKVWWKCPKADDHEWQTTVASRAAGTGCPCCRNMKAVLSNCLATTHPDLARQWHPTKNGDLTPNQVVARSEKKVWWKCSKGPDHEWQAALCNRTSSRPTGCPYCAGRQVSATNSLATCFPALASQWHPTKNGDLTPDQVAAGSHMKVWWQCPKGPDHEWQARPNNRMRSGTGCPCCEGLKVSVTNSLTSRFPGIVLEWHPIKNGNLTPDQLVAGSERKVWWLCPRDPTHEWQATLSSRTLKRGGTGCPYCNRGWTLELIRVFVLSLREHVTNFTPAELYILFQQNGLLATTGKGKGFVKALATGRFPKEEIEKFINGEPSLVDQFVQDPTQTLEALETNEARPDGAEDDVLDQADAVIEQTEEEGEQQLPVVQTKDVLASLGFHVVSSADEEAVEFLLASAVAKIWKHAYQDETSAVAQTEAFHGDGYAEQIRTRFLDEYRQAKDLAIPPGYAFQINGKLALPLLMQRHFAVRVQERKRVGNWSGTGAGKTLAAVLATRVVGSKLTVICCPNSVVEGWRRGSGTSFRTASWRPRPLPHLGPQRSG